MKNFIFLLLVAVAASETIDIDWSKVKPLQDYPEFWEGKPNKPSAKHFERVDNYKTASRIANGNVAGRHDFPFMGALVAAMPFGDALCGASLINRWFVMTAASCLDAALSTVIILGGSDLNAPEQPFQARWRVQAKNFILHPLFRTGITNSDIGLVQFNFEIAFFNQAVRPVALPTDDMLNDQLANQLAIVAGFGQESSTATDYSMVLHFTEATTLTPLACRLASPGIVDDPRHICTSGIGGRGFCQGDIGSPLLIERNGGYIQIGIASLFAGGCSTNTPSVYTRLTFFTNWVRQQVGSFA